MQRLATETLPILLLPGLNGDPRVWAPQVAAFPEAKVASWIPALPNECLSDYAQRLARLIDPGRPCAVAGVSFGGIVAQEMCRYLNARCCVVIASSRGDKGLPGGIRFVRRLNSVMPEVVVDWGFRAGWETAGSAVPSLRRRRRRLSSEQTEFQRWAVRQLICWEPAELGSCPVFQIHGDCDARFPRGATDADYVVRGGGHVVTLTHGDEVNEVMAGVIGKCAV